MISFSACGTLNGFVCYRFRTGCYCVVTTQMSWTMAYNYCLTNGRSLLSIQSQSKQNDLQVNLPSVIGTSKLKTSFQYLNRMILFMFDFLFLHRQCRQSSRCVDFRRLFPTIGSILLVVSMPETRGSSFLIHQLANRRTQ